MSGVAAVSLLCVLLISGLRRPTWQRLLFGFLFAGVGPPLVAALLRILVGRIEPADSYLLDHQLEAAGFAVFRACERWSIAFVILALFLEAPFLGVFRGSGRLVSAEHMDDMVLVVGIGTVANSAVFRLIVPAGPAVDAVLVSVSVLGLVVAAAAQSRRLGRRRWLARLARDSDVAWALRPLDRDELTAGGMDVLLDEGGTHYAVVERGLAIEDYRGGPLARPPWSARIALANSVNVDTEIGVPATVAQLLWRFAGFMIDDASDARRRPPEAAAANGAFGVAVTWKGLSLAVLGCGSFLAICFTLALFGYWRKTRGYARAEATAMIVDIAGAEYAYANRTGHYLNVSGGSLENAFPRASLAAGKVTWDPGSCAGTPVCDRFKALEVPPTSSVQYRYSVVAGEAGELMPAVGRFPRRVADGAWFAIRATADLNGDGRPSVLVYFSTDRAIYDEAPSED